MTAAETLAQTERKTTREGGEELVRVAGLRKVYGTGSAERVVLDSLDFTLRRGELVAVVGPSGAGKSTLLHLVAALDTPTSGTVYFAGKSLASLASADLAEFRGRAVGFVWQRHHLLADFTAAENAAMPLLVEGQPYREALDRARHWLGEVGLGERAGQSAGELSGGEQQRVAIARALVNRPALLVADEPTGDLDEQNAFAIYELIERLHRSHGLSSIVATHNLALARRADRVLGLERGRLVGLETGMGSSNSFPGTRGLGAGTGTHTGGDRG